MAERLGELTERMKRVEERNEFLKYCWLLAKNNGRYFEASCEADRLFPHGRAAVVLKTAIPAGDTITPGWASELADYKLLTSEWISLLSSRTVIGRLPFRRVNFHTRTLVQTTPGSAGWVAEAAPIPASRMSLAAAQVEISKIAGIVFFTRESLEIWNPNTAAQINAAMLSTLGRYSDIALLAPELVAVSGTNPGSITSGLTPTTSTGSSEAAITANLKTMIQTHTDLGADPLDLGIVMHPTTALHLSTLLTAGNIRAFPNVGINGGEIFGVPVLTTAGAVTLGSPSERVVVVINAKGILVADDGQIDVSTARAGSMSMDNAPSGAQNQVSMFQTHSVAMKFVRTLSFLRADDRAVSYMQVSY